MLYKSSILRYRHNPFRNEVLNAGVLAVTEDKDIFFKAVDNASRFSAVFDMDENIFMSTLDYILHSINASKSRSIEWIIDNVIIDQELGFHWSSVSHGVTNDLENDFNTYFDRYVL